MGAARVQISLKDSMIRHERAEKLKQGAMVVVIMAFGRPCHQREQDAR